MKPSKVKSFSATLLKSIGAAVIASAMDAIISVDAEQSIVLFNPAAERMFKCKSNTALGQPLDRFISEKFREILRRDISKLKPAKASTRRMGKPRTLHGLRTDGKKIPVEASISQVEVKGRKIFTVILRDVTATKQAEAKLCQREDYFRSLIEYASDLITVANQDGIIRFQSPSVQHALRLKPAEMTGHSLAEFIHPEDMPRLSEMIQRTLANPASPVAIDYHIRHRDGTWRLFSCLGRSIPLKGSEKIIVFNARDITESRHLEKQLLQAQKMEAIGTLAGGVAHDFNNMLAGILGSAELLREDLPADHRAQEYAKAIMMAGNRAKDLVQQILTFSRQRENEKTLLPLQPIVGECVKLLRSTIPAMVQIISTVDPACPAVLADPTQIHQVIMNICTNAWQALPAQGGRIDLSLQTEDANTTAAARYRQLGRGRYVKLSIRDNGHGMDKATRDRIFEPFFTTKPAGKGSGLGLSVVHGIVKSHGGVVLVESEPGKGTAFHVYFPARETPGANLSRPAEAIPRGHGQRILFVDDEPIVGKTTEEFLRRLGYNVTRCEQSEEALTKFRQTPQNFDLLITDWAMPGMSGTELVTAARNLRPEIPLLLVSGFVDTLLQETVKMMGVEEVLLKPVSSELMAHAIARTLAAREALRV
jgi:PAS domain S-box-containing protein